MAKVKEVLKAFEDKGIKLVHGMVKNSTEEKVTLPAYCYLLGSGADVRADNITHYKQVEMRIEIYYKTLTTGFLETIEQIFDDLEIGYDCDLDIYIDEEKCFMAIYEIEVER